MTNTPTARVAVPSHEDRYMHSEIPEVVPSASHDATDAPVPERETVSNADYSMVGYNQRTNEPLLPTGPVLQGLQPSTLNSTTFDSGSAAFSDFMQGGQGLGQSSDPGNPLNLDPFSGFDIPFWFEQDQYWDILQNSD
jgi:hypothetical protein